MDWQEQWTYCQRMRCAELVEVSNYADLSCADEEVITMLRQAQHKYRDNRSKS